MNLFKFTDTKPPVAVQESDYARLLGYPAGYSLEDRSRELADATRQWFKEHGRPWMFARLAGGLSVSEKRIQFGDTAFTSARLRSQFVAADVHDAVLVAVSAGAECEAEAARRWQDGKPDEYFFLETFGSAVVENLVAIAAGKICSWADQNGLGVLPHYSPGYAGWPVSDQPALWKIIAADNHRNLPGELHVMDSGMLQPKKSLLAVFGLTRHRDRVQTGSHLIPCVNCVLPDCSYRRAPFRHFIRQSQIISETCTDTYDQAL